MHKQKGMTMVSWMFVLTVVGVVGVAALNIIPSYLNFFSARSILENLETDPITRGKTSTDIKSIISKRLSINNLKQIDVAKSIKFKSTGTRGDSAYKVILNYEDRGRIIGNLYFVTVFNHEVEINP